MNNKEELKTLGEICEHPEYGYTTSATLDENGPKFVRTTDISNGKLDWDKVPYCLKSPEDEDRYLLKQGDILIARAGTVGASIVINNPIRAVFASYLIRFRLKENINPFYIGFFLKSQQFKNQLYAQSSGTTLKGINATNLSKIKIPLPPLPIQNKIVAILEKVESAIEKRKETIRLADEFLKSTFLEMFGDPVFNYNHFRIERLEDICIKITDGTHDTPERLNNGIMFITGKHIKPFEIDYDNCDFVSEVNHKIIYKRCNPEYEDVLYTNIGVNLGTAAINKIKKSFSMKNVALLKNNQKVINSYYLCHVLNISSMKSEILRLGSLGGARNFLSPKDIRNIKIPVPPMPLQIKFNKIMKQTEFANNKIIQNDRELNNLYDSLMQKLI